MRTRLPLCLLCTSLALGAQQEGRASLAGKEVAYLYSVPPAQAPALLFLPQRPGPEAARACWRQWQPLAAERGWGLAVPASDAALIPGSDASVRALAAIAEDFLRRGPIDPARLYLAGQADGASVALYAAARVPDLWSAVLAIGGSPRAAIESNRLFAANTQLVPVLWITPSEQAAVLGPLRARLLSAGYNLDRTAAPATPGQALDWLAAHRRDPFPQQVDCETGNPAFARCYWVELTKLDPARRNDVLASTRVPPGSGAFLALGGFGFDVSAPGPGVLIGWLPENYKGPLRLDDRIVAVGGTEIANGQAYVDFMSGAAGERRVAITVLRGKQRLRLDTRIVLPERGEALTVRMQAEFLPQTREILLITRGVAELRLNLPPYWTPARITWNGLEAGAAEAPGCWLISEGGRARRCVD